VNFQQFLHFFLKKWTQYFPSVSLQTSGRRKYLQCENAMRLIFGTIWSADFSSENSETEQHFHAVIGKKCDGNIPQLLVHILSTISASKGRNQASSSTHLVLFLAGHDSCCGKLLQLHLSLTFSHFVSESSCMLKYKYSI